MNILVYDVAAESGGALMILRQFYNKHRLDKENHYFYLLSIAELEGGGNIEVINIPWIKKSWLHRLVFDYFCAPRFVKRYHIDAILSLQNMCVPNVKVFQSVYVHNALPFSEYRFGFFESRALWMYQNLIGRRIKRSVQCADKVIVQTEWMKRAIEDDVKNMRGTVEVEFPVIEGFVPDSYKPSKLCVFFYPANSSKFKNHKVIFEAAKQLKQQGISNYQCVFTLHGNETKEIRKIYKEGMRLGLPFQWIGQVSKDKMGLWYSKSVLLYSSYIETVGLPIYEAIICGSPLLLAHRDYSEQVSNLYNNVTWFDNNDANDLVSHMRSIILERNR